VVPTIQDAAYPLRVRFATRAYAGPAYRESEATAAVRPPRQTYDYRVLCTKQLPDKYDLAETVALLVTPSLTSIVLIQN
jgi:hypothetical protein